MQFRRGRLIPGLILILLGVAFLLREYLGVGPEFVLILAGLLFLAPYLFMRVYGLLIPGMILLGLGLGLLYERVAHVGWAVPLGLGLGFVAIFLMDWLATRALRWWPLIPGAALMIPAILGAFPESRVWLDKGWPLILIVLGVLLLGLNFTPRNQPKSGESDGVHH